MTKDISTKQARKEGKKLILEGDAFLPAFGGRK